MEIHIINGPNLNLLGKREPEIYGHKSFDAYFQRLQEKFSSHELYYFQSNHEGEIIDYLHQFGFNAHGFIVNAGAYTHTSLAIADAIRAIPAKVIEVHISNVFSRENYRHHSYMAEACIGVISGFGLHSYTLALEAFLRMHDNSQV